MSEIFHLAWFSCLVEGGASNLSRYAHGGLRITKGFVLLPPYGPEIIPAKLVPEDAYSTFVL